MDYKFAIRCWQDQAGDENAKANVFVDGVQVATEVAVTATSADSPQIIAWESTGLTAPAAGTSFDIKVVMTNEYYVDADTDRNINIDGVGYITKDTDNNYKKKDLVVDADNPGGHLVTSTITDFDDYANYVYETPTAVTGDQTDANWWANRGNTDFETIVVWGGDANGMTMTMGITENSF